MDAFIRDLDDEVHGAAKAAAIARGETLNAFIVRAIQTAVSNDPIASELLRFVRNKIRRAKAAGAGQRS